MKLKYNLGKMLEEIEEDKKVFAQKKDYWASQQDIKKMVEKMKKKAVSK